MIDLHIHTNFSDGTEDCINVLKRCEDKKLEYISITDHNTAEAYNELEKINITDYYSGKIISGIELNTKILNIPIEILGYGIDYKKMNELVKKIYISEEDRNTIEIKRLYEKCLKYGIVLDKHFLDNYDKNTFASVLFHKEIIKYTENKNLISEDAWNDSRCFYRRYMSNPQTPLYVEMDDFVPDFETASNLIRDCNGLVFIPHIFEYKENSDIILKHILDNYKIDGIECFYTSFSKEQHANILKICRDKNLFISGGSDFHGSSKPNVEIGSGYGNLEILSHFIIPWINKIDCLKNKMNSLI